MKQLQKELICINCPNGCHLTVTGSGTKIKVTGNKCPKGLKYGIEEVTAPKRIVTAIVKVKNKEHTYLPVKSSQPVLKKNIIKLLKKIYSMETELPVKRGEILIKNYDNSGIDIIFTRSMANSLHFS